MRFSPAKLRHHSTARRIVAALVLLVYLTANLGLPMGMAGGSGCQCDTELQQSNQCCCARQQLAKELDTPRSCCTQKLTLVTKSDSVNTKSCCQKTSVKSCCQQKETATPSRERTGAYAHSCSCGSGSQPGYLFNAEPRILNASLKPAVEPDYGDIVALTDQMLASDADAPETPPPKLSA